MAGLADKRRAILTGGLEVFARDGYTRASIDTIAATAGVSTRTIYNHFHDKAELFGAVIQHSAAQVAEDVLMAIDRHFHKITDLEADLIAFGRDLAMPPTAPQAAHFHLVRQINAEAGHIPQDAINAWQEIGPLRVQRALAERLERLAERGLLRISDPDSAARHLLLLIDTSTPRGERPDKAEIEATVTSGVRTFLYGYLEDRGPRAPRSV